MFYAGTLDKLLKETIRFIANEVQQLLETKSFNPHRQFAFEPH